MESAQRHVFLLNALDAGDEQAARKLLPVVYAELRAIAAGSIGRAGPGVSLRPTELVHEVWLKFSNDPDRVWNDRRHFISAAALAMRQVVIDWARRKRAAKRGGTETRMTLDDTISQLDVNPDDAITIDQALTELAQTDVRAAKVVEMKFFLGLSDPEIADALNVTDRTVRRDWTFARSWLSRRLAGSFGIETSQAPAPALEPSWG